MVRVLIVGEHLLVRQGLKQVLREEFRDLAVGEARRPAQAAVRLGSRPCDLLVIDIGPACEEAYGLLHEIRRDHPSTRVLVLGMEGRRDLAVHARQLGAAGYVPMNASRFDLVKAIKSVLAGEKHFDSLSSQAFSSQAHAVPGLSPREHAVMLALAAGKKNKDIAAELKLSVKTTTTYRRRILDKLNLESTAHLVRYVLDNRLS